MAVRLSEGSTMPSFALPDANGNITTSQSLLEQGPLVVFFYPKDETRICTLQACMFRDHYADFGDAGAQVVGISDDSPSSHHGFRANHELPFTLLSDHKGATRRAFGVRNTLAVLRGRETFVIDRDGIVRSRFRSASDYEGHVISALNVVRRLRR